MSSQFNLFKSFAPLVNYYSVRRYTTEVKRLYGVLKSRLAAMPYLGGPEYSIVDMAVFSWILNQSRRYGEVGWTKVDRLYYPAISRWFADIAGREAVKRAVLVVDGIGSTSSARPPTIWTAFSDEENMPAINGRGARRARAHGPYLLRPS